MTAAKFITFEGGEGAGKSTQARLLAAKLAERGVEAVLTREPGGSPFAEQVRELLLSPQTAAHEPLAETLLFYAARADHLHRTIRPALKVGKWVICDRFSDSTRVYQGAAGGLDAGTIAAFDAMVVAPTLPDLTVILDLPATEGLARATERREAGVADSYESRALAFHERLRDGFLAIGKGEPERCAIVDASRSPDEVAGDVWNAVAARLLEEGA